MTYRCDDDKSDQSQEQEERHLNLHPVQGKMEEEQVLDGLLRSLDLLPVSE